jgi:hypothetical protein
MEKKSLAYQILYQAVKKIQQKTQTNPDEAKAYGLVDIAGDEMICEHYDIDTVWFPEMFKDWSCTSRCMTKAETPVSQKKRKGTLNTKIKVLKVSPDERNFLE